MSGIVSLNSETLHNVNTVIVRLSNTIVNHFVEFFIHNILSIKNINSMILSQIMSRNSVTKFHI